MGLPAILSALAVTLLVFKSITTTTAASQNASCYFPDGSLATSNDLPYAPCKDISSADGATFCCLFSDVCTVGGYCVGGAGAFYRGGCTDLTWTSSHCPSLCANVRMNTFTNFYPCNPGEFGHDNWVCGVGSGNNCNTTSFYFDPGALFVPAGQAVTATSTVTVTGSGATIVAPTAAASPLPYSGSCPTHNGTIIGLSVGLGLGLALLAIAALFGLVVERRKRRSAEKEAAEARGSRVYHESNLKGDPHSNYMAHEAGSQPLHEMGHGHR